MSSSLPRIEKNQIFTEIRKCMDMQGPGFFTTCEGKVVKVESIKDGTPKKYDLTWKKIDTLPEGVIPIPCPTSSVSIQEKKQIYYVKFDEKEEEFVSDDKGCILSVNQVGNDIIFTVDGSQELHTPGNPVFTYDESNQSLHLIGVISAAQDIKQKETSVVSINTLNLNDLEDEDLGPERGGIPVYSGIFAGREKGKGGSGPRFITITGNSEHRVNVTYKLSLKIDGKTLQAHQDSKYNKKENKKDLYQQAINQFNLMYIQQQNIIPDRFNFTYKKSDYIAEKN